MADNTPKGSSSSPAPQGGDSGNVDLSITPKDQAPQSDTKPAAAPAAPAATKPAEDTAAPKPSAPATTEKTKAEGTPAPSPSSSAPATTPAPKSDASGDKKSGGLSFTNIFNQEKTKKKDTKMISSVLKKKDDKKSKAKPILGTAPALQKSLEEEKKLQLKRKLRLSQIVFIVVFLAGLASAGYFYTELSPTFDVFGLNTTQRLADTNRNLRETQANINKYRYLAAQLDLNRFSYVSDDFLTKTAQLADGAGARAATLQQAVSQDATQLPSLLTNIREQLSHDIIVPTTRSQAEEEITTEEVQKNAENALRNAILEERRGLMAEGSELTPEERSELELYDNAVKLVGNDALLSRIRSASIDDFTNELSSYVSSSDPEVRSSLNDFMSGILASTKSNIATVAALKAERIEWSTIMARIEEVTADVDVTFSFSNVSTGDGIFYTNYDFDTTTNKIVLSGTTRTTKADNFTVITNLMEALEDSPYFQDVEMRSFTKSGSFAEGFTANFKIDLALETDNFSSSQESPLSLDSRSIARTTGIKRTP